MTKTEDEIAREKDMVQKMVGAKSAMDAALSRITRLEQALRNADMVLSDMQRHVGEGIYVKTHYHGGQAGEATVKLKDQIGYVRNIMGKVQ